jgi:hypothetical protein
MQLHCYVTVALGLCADVQGMPSFGDGLWGSKTMSSACVFAPFEDIERASSHPPLESFRSLFLTSDSAAPDYTLD